MKKKTFLAITLFLIITMLTTLSLAAETMNNIKNSFESFGNTTGNMLGTAGASIENGVNKLENGTENMVNNMDGTNNSDYMQESNYSAARTSTSANASNNLFGLSSNVWNWIILGIVGAIIIGLVWYYGTQFENADYENR